MLRDFAVDRLKGPSMEAGARCQNHPDLPVAHERTTFSWRKLFFLSLATAFFAIGLLGVFLPGLPATPFFLLASHFLVRSSPRLNAALLRSRLFGPTLVDWQVHGGVRAHVRFKAIAVVVITVGITIFLTNYSLWPTLAVVSLATVGITVILRLPVAKEC
ncbi:MAG: YbaN family protein [Planctomycetes bacterium]|nr:YbaN family protein [Planctomycetota bacterium]